MAIEIEISIRKIVLQQIGEHHPNLDEIVSEIEEELGFEPGYTETFSLEELERRSAEYSGFDRWGCARCVAINMTLAAAVGTAVALGGPWLGLGTSKAVAYLVAEFGISEAVAGAALGGTSGAALAKILCEDPC